LRWSLIILFMLVKAGLIVAIFMHMRWERLALKFAILIPRCAAHPDRPDGDRRRAYVRYPLGAFVGERLLVIVWLAPRPLPWYSPR